MKGYKLDLSEYLIDMPIPYAQCPKCKKEQEFRNDAGILSCVVCNESPDSTKTVVRSRMGKKPYMIRESIANIILHPDQKHDGFRQYTVSKVAKKIIECSEDFIVLEPSEYRDIVKKSFETVRGYGRNDTELLRRVFEALEIDLEEKRKEKK